MCPSLFAGRRGGGGMTPDGCVPAALGHRISDVALSRASRARARAAPAPAPPRPRPRRPRPAPDGGRARRRQRPPAGPPLRRFGAAARPASDRAAYARRGGQRRSSSPAGLPCHGSLSPCPALVQAVHLLHRGDDASTSAMACLAVVLGLSRLRNGRPHPLGEKRKSAGLCAACAAYLVLYLQPRQPGGRRHLHGKSANPGLYSPLCCIYNRANPEVGLRIWQPPSLISTQKTTSAGTPVNAAPTGIPSRSAAPGASSDPAAPCAATAIGGHGPPCACKRRPGSTPPRGAERAAVVQEAHGAGARVEVDGDGVARRGRLAERRARRVRVVAELPVVRVVRPAVRRRARVPLARARRVEAALGEHTPSLSCAEPSSRTVSRRRWARASSCGSRTTAQRNVLARRAPARR